MADLRTETDYKMLDEVKKWGETNWPGDFSAVIRFRDLFPILVIQVNIQILCQQKDEVLKEAKEMIDVSLNRLRSLGIGVCDEDDEEISD